MYKIILAGSLSFFSFEHLSRAESKVPDSNSGIKILSSSEVTTQNLLKRTVFVLDQLPHAPLRVELGEKKVNWEDRIELDLIEHAILSKLLNEQQTSKDVEFAPFNLVAMMPDSSQCLSGSFTINSKMDQHPSFKNINLGFVNRSLLASKSSKNTFDVRLFPSRKMPNHSNGLSVLNRLEILGLNQSLVSYYNSADGKNNSVAINFLNLDRAYLSDIVENLALVNAIQKVSDSKISTSPSFFDSTAEYLKSLFDWYYRTYSTKVGRSGATSLLNTENAHRALLNRFVELRNMGKAESTISKNRNEYNIFNLDMLVAPYPYALGCIGIKVGFWGHSNSLFVEEMYFKKCF